MLGGTFLARRIERAELRIRGRMFRMFTGFYVKRVYTPGRMLDRSMGAEGNGTLRG